MKKILTLFLVMFAFGLVVFANDKIDINNTNIDSIATKAYTGKAITPDVSITYSETLLEKGTDYTVSYKNNVKVGTASVVIKGMGDYTGTKTVTFKIAYSMPKAKVTGVVAKTYTGKTQGQKITVKYGSATLKAGTHYTVSYLNNKDAGTATLILTGKGNYVGTKKVTFKINRKSITGFTFSKVNNYVYSGKAITPNVTVKNGTVSLVKGTDYKLTYTNNINKGTATVTVTGIGNYTGTKKITYKINARSIATVAAEGIVAKTYTGKAIYQSYKLTFGEKTLVKGTDYTLVYTNNVKVGTATITFTGKGNYTGTLKKTFKIVGVKILEEEVTGIKDKWYTGKAITQSVTVKNGTTTLKNVTDYTVTYKNNVKPGEATVVITGKGNYSGTITKTFEIFDTYGNYKNVKWAGTSSSINGSVKLYIKNGKVYLDNYDRKGITVTGYEGNPKSVIISVIGGGAEALLLTDKNYVYNINVWEEGKTTKAVKFKTGILDMTDNAGGVVYRSLYFLTTNGKLINRSGYTFEQINQNFVKQVGITLDEIFYLDEDGYMYMDKYPTGTYDYYKFEDFKPSKIFRLGDSYDSKYSILVLATDNKLYSISSKVDDEYNFIGFEVTKPFGDRTVKNFEFTKEIILENYWDIVDEETRIIERPHINLELFFNDDVEYGKAVLHNINEYGHYIDLESDDWYIEVDEDKISSVHDVYDISSNIKGTFDYDTGKKLYIDNYDYVYYKKGNNEYVRITNMKVNKINYYKSKYINKLLLIGDNKAMAIEYPSDYPEYNLKYDIYDTFDWDGSGMDPEFDDINSILNFILSENEYALVSSYDNSINN